MTERQVGERLSEQSEILAGRLARGIAPDLMGSVSQAEWQRFGKEVLTLARQLAEAERENAKAKADVGAEYVLRRKAEREAARYRDALEAESPRVMYRLRDEARLRVLGDPPASPAEGSEAATEVEA